MPNDDGQGASKPAAKKEDVVLMHSRTDDGEGVRVLRARDGKLETGEVRALKEGVPVSGEVVTLTQRKEHPALWDVDVHCRTKPTRSHAGPARVSSRAYRDNWDVIFKERAAGQEDDKLLN